VIGTMIHLFSLRRGFQGVGMGDGGGQWGLNSVNGMRQGKGGQENRSGEFQAVGDEGGGGQRK
jgi:hypothetical protein